MRNLLIWFIGPPILAVVLSGFFCDLRPQTFHQLLVQQHLIEDSIQALRSEIDGLRVDPSAPHDEINRLEAQLAVERGRLARFKHPSASNSDAYLPLSLLTWLAGLCLGIAVTNRWPISRHWRAAGLSAGTALGAIIIVQWVVVTVQASALCALIAGIVAILLMLAGLIVCWVVTLRSLGS